MRALNPRADVTRRNGPNTLSSEKATICSEPTPGPPPIEEERVLKIMRMVESGPARTIRDLAIEMHLSTSRLQRLFKHETGISMGEWLINQRLQRAAQLLEKSYLSVKEIAHAVGYEHPSSFIRAFERRFAQAPTRYRKERLHEMLTKAR